MADGQSAGGDAVAEALARIDAIQADVLATDGVQMTRLEVAQGLMNGYRPGQPWSKATPRDRRKGQDDQEAFDETVADFAAVVRAEQSAEVEGLREALEVADAGFLAIAVVLSGEIAVESTTLDDLVEHNALAVRAALTDGAETTCATCKGKGLVLGCQRCGLEPVPTDGAPAPAPRQEVD